MLKPLAIVLLLVAAAASGCLGGSDATTDTTDTTSGASSDNAPPAGTSANGSSPSGPPATATNTPPTARLTANLTNGSAPLAVSFAIEASDADGDDLSWSLDADGDGQTDATGDEVPATVNATYNEAGLFVATLDVTDGNASVRSTVEINVTAIVTSGGPVTLHFVGDGSTTVIADPSSAQAGTNPCVTDFGLSPDGHGGDGSTFVVFPSGNPSLGRNCLLPSFIFEGGVTLTGGPVTIHAFVNFACPPNLAADTFPLHALLMNAAGSALGPLAAAYADPGTSASEIVFTFTPEAGTYDGLQVQYGKSATSGPESPCLPFVTQWGSDAHDGRVVLAPGDAVTASS